MGSTWPPPRVPRRTGAIASECWEGLVVCQRSPSSLFLNLAHVDKKPQREAQRDPEFELAVAKWVEKAVGEPLADVNDLWVSLRSGVVLCQLVNRIVPGTIKKFAKTNLLPLVEMDNIQLYLRACWNLGIPSGDFFIVSDLYHKKSIQQVIQNIVSLSRIAPSLGYDGEPLVAGNTGKDRVKNWETVAAGGATKRVEELEAGTPAERITQLSIQLGEARHALDASKSDNFHLQATLKELRAQQAAERERWESEKLTLENRLKKFAPIDDGGEGAPGSMAVKALELHYQNEVAAAKATAEEERKKYAALEARMEEMKQKQSQTALELSKMKQDEKKKVGGVENRPAPEKPAWMSKVAAKKPSVRAPSVRMPTMTAEQLAASGAGGGGAMAGSVGRSRAESVALSDSEGSYRLSVMLQLKSNDGSADSHKTGFFFSADDLGAEGVEYLSEQLDLLFSNQTIEADASTILNDMLLADAGRRTFTFALKEKLRALNFQKVQLDAAPFLTLLSLVNSALTGMQLGKQIDYIAMTFLLGASRAVFTTGSRSQMEEFLADHLRDHSIWADVRFWEQHFWDVIGKAFKKKFARLSLGKAQQAGWLDEQSKFLSQFVASFAHEMGRWSMPEAAMKEFFELVFERLVLSAKYQAATRAYYDKLVSRQVAKQLQDTAKLKHVSMVMTSSQAARLAGPGAGPKAGGGQAAKAEADANILQGWLKRKVHIMWITEWVSQSGTHLAFREFKSSTQKRIVVSLDKLTKVEVRNDSSLPNSRCIYIEAGDTKLVVAPVKDTDEEINYWLKGLKKMQARFNSGPLPKPSPKVPVKNAELQQKQQAVAASTTPPTSSTVAVPATASASAVAATDQGLGEETSSSSLIKAVRSPTFTRALPTTGARSSAFVTPASPVAAAATAAPTGPLEGWMQLNVTKDIAKKFKGLKTGWTPLWVVQDGAKVAFYRTAQKEEEFGAIDLCEVTQMETTTHEDMTSDVIRLLTKAIVYMVCPPNADMFDAWHKGLGAARKRLLGKTSSLNDLPTAHSVGTMEPGSFTIGRSRNKTVSTSNRLSSDDSRNAAEGNAQRGSGSSSNLGRVSGAEEPASPVALAVSPKMTRADGGSEKLEGWVQFKGAAAGPKPGKGLLGTLKKMTSSKWSPMWFSLTGSTVFMFKSQEDMTCLGELDMEQVTGIEETTDKEMIGNVLRLAMLTGEFNLLCPKEAEFHAWRDRLQAAVSKGASKQGSAVLSASSPSLGRNSLFGKLGRSSSALLNSRTATVDRPAPASDAALSGWVHLEEGKKWTKQWLAQKGTILTLSSSPEDTQPRGHYDLSILTKVEGVTGPDAHGPAVMCWFGEFNTVLFSPERGHQNYWLTGLGMLLDRYKPQAAVSGSSRLSKGGAPAAVAAAAPAPVFAAGTQVWAQFEADSFWYRAKVDASRPGDIYDVTFSEYGNQQTNCTLNKMRAIDDPAMLALLGTTIEKVTGASSVDRMRPMSVQLPASIAEALRKANATGTYVAIDPAMALQEQAQESGEEATLADSPTEEPPSPVAALVTESSVMSRKAVDSMFVGVLQDDEDEDEDEEARQRAAAEELLKKQAAEQELKRVQMEERKEKLRAAKAARDSKAEEDKKAREEAERKSKAEREEQATREREEAQRVAELEAKRAEEAKAAKLRAQQEEEEEERRMLEAEQLAVKEEEERQRQHAEEEAARLAAEEERLTTEKKQRDIADAETARKDALRKEAERKETERAESARKAALAAAETENQEAEARAAAAAVVTAKAPPSPRATTVATEAVSDAAATLVAPGSADSSRGSTRSAAVQAALARAKARTAAIKTDAAPESPASSSPGAGVPRKPLPDPFD